jgi:hypothetical protein
MLICLLSFLTLSFHDSSLPLVGCRDLTDFPFCNTSLPIDDRVWDLVSRIQDDEKAALLTARGPGGVLKDIPRLGVPTYYWGTNCLHALNQVGVGEIFLCCDKQKIGTEK